LAKIHNDPNYYLPIASSVGLTVIDWRLLYLKYKVPVVIRQKILMIVGYCFWADIFIEID